MIDLDIVTVSIWDSKGENVKLAIKFTDRIKNKEFYVATPFYLLEHLMQWKHIRLKEQIENFYIKNSDRLITSEDIETRIDELEIDDVKILSELQSHDVKEEDAFIVLVAAIFDIDYLVTFNRKHLRGKKKEINDVLKKMELRLLESMDQKRFRLALHNFAPFNPITGNAFFDFISKFYWIHICRYFNSGFCHNDFKSNIIYKHFVQK